MAGETNLKLASVKAATGTSSRTFGARFDDVVNVFDFGARGLGVIDESSNVQAAVNSAFNRGVIVEGSQKGANVFFPPGVYNLGTTGLNFTGEGNGSINLIGSGRESTVLFGNVNGFVVDKPEDGAASLEVVRDMTIKNNSASSGTGALRMQGSNHGTIHNCLINGFYGIVCDSNAYGIQIIGCDVNWVGLQSGSVGIFATQANLMGVRLMGWDKAIVGYNVGLRIGGASSCESCNTAITLGALIDGTYDACTGFIIDSFQTERCSTAIEIINASSGSLGPGLKLTGTIGPGRKIQSIAWSGGTATLTSVPNLTWASGAKTIKLEDTGTAYDGFYTATRQSATTFSFASADHGSVGAVGTWSRLPLYGIRVRGSQNIIFQGFGVSVGDPNGIEYYGIDLVHDDPNLTSGGQVTFDTVSAGPGGWNPPPTQDRPRFEWRNCDYYPEWLFTQLPGEAGNSNFTTRYIGMEYNISDGTIADSAPAGNKFGGIVSGGGSTRCRVRWNGTNWTAMAK